jgi:hypothetical protein
LRAPASARLRFIVLRTVGDDEQIGQGAAGRSGPRGVRNDVFVHRIQGIFKMRAAGPKGGVLARIQQSGELSGKVVDGAARQVGGQTDRAGRRAVHVRLAKVLDERVESDAELVVYPVLGLGGVGLRQQGVDRVAYGVEAQLNARRRSGICAGANLRIGPIHLVAVVRIGAGRDGSRRRSETRDDKSLAIASRRRVRRLADGRDWPLV